MTNEQIDRAVTLEVFGDKGAEGHLQFSTDPSLLGSLITQAEKVLGGVTLNHAGDDDGESGSFWRVSCSYGAFSTSGDFQRSLCMLLIYDARTREIVEEAERESASSRDKSFGVMDGETLREIKAMKKK